METENKTEKRLQKVSVWGFFRQGLHHKESGVQTNSTGGSLTIGTKEGTKDASTGMQQIKSVLGVI